MIKQLRINCLAYLILLTLLTATGTHAEARIEPSSESNVFDVVNAVNALRGAYGLPAYSINSILMFTAQSQADFMASTGNVTHTGPGGSGLTQRLLAAGYPLGGDLSLGGFRAENITSGGISMTAEDAVTAWMGDALHQNTMLSPDLTEIGAGVAVANGHVYYVIDCAQPSTGGAPPAGTAAVGSESAVPANEAPINAVVVSTSNPSGDVIHEVKSGQTLWQLAIAYGVKIEDIKRQNNLFGNEIYPGDKLLIKKEAAPTTAASVETIMPESTLTTMPSEIATLTLAPTTAPAVVAVRQNNGTVVASVIAIVALAILGAGYFTWLGKSNEDQSH